MDASWNARLRVEQLGLNNSQSLETSATAGTVGAAVAASTTAQTLHPGGTEAGAAPRSRQARPLEATPTATHRHLVA